MAVSHDPQEVMNAVDQALEPVFRNAQRLGVPSFGDLGQIARSFRQALAVAVYGVTLPDPAPAEEANAGSDPSIAIDPSNQQPDGPVAEVSAADPFAETST